MNYTNREVVRRLKQYDMFLNSLKLTTDKVQRERICDQLDKIEKQILLETNSEYEEEYMSLMNENVKFFDEEKLRLNKLISLINSRKEYLDNRKNKHKDITGSLVELTTFLGEDKLSYFKKKLKTIEKYEENKIIKENIIEDMKLLDVRISEASRNVKANMRLNDMLENKMMSLVEKKIDKLGLFSLLDSKSDILRKHSSLSYALDMASENLNSAKELEDKEMMFECEELLSQINSEFTIYNQKLNIIKLIETYDKAANGYDELLKKRENIEEILKNIVGTELYNEINEELSKEYNTIKLEKQDIKDYDFLKVERDKKNKQLYQIEEENNSKEFKQMIEDLIKNENKYREEQIKLARKQESKEREKRLIEEQKIEAARVRRQKLLEEARLKDQMERAEILKGLQDNTVIGNKKEENKEVEEKPQIKNPLKDKSFDEIINPSSFDTDELFENTRIVPNKVNENSTSEPSIEGKEEITESPNLTNENDNVEISNNEENIVLDNELPLWEPMVNDNNDCLVDEMPKIEEPKMEFPKYEENKNTETNNNSSSIYDILENNDNIIWKSTETKGSLNEIPVIKNNMVNKNNNNFDFPELGSKDGDILWKETL